MEQEATIAQYKKVEKIINSLASSTNITYHLRQKTVVIEGRDNPTHGIISVGHGHGFVEFVVIIDNKKDTLAITPYYPAGRFEGSFKSVLLPSFHIIKLFENSFPVVCPQWIYEELFVYVTYLDPYINKNGKFVELPEKEQFVKYKTQVRGKDAEFTFYPKTKDHDTICTFSLKK